MGGWEGRGGGGGGGGGDTWSREEYFIVLCIKITICMSMLMMLL